METANIPFIDLRKQYEHIKEDLGARIHKVMSSFAFIQGPEVKELEGLLAEYVGVPEVISCANGTDALSLPLLAYNLAPGDAVFCPTFTFIATSEVVSLRGATPIFVDVDPKTFNMDPEDLKKKIQKARADGEFIPKVIITVDLFGLPANYPAIEKIAEEFDLIVLEDAAQGFGGRIGQKKAGSFGKVSGTSFFPAKPLGCYGDGGAIFTEDKELADILRSLRSHGQGKEKYEHQRVGLNSRLDSMQAAILLSKLKVFPEELDKRQKVAERYTKQLKDIVDTPVVPKNYLSSWAQYTIKVPAEKRDKIVSFMKGKGVPTMIYYPKALHLQPAYRKGLRKIGECPKAEKLCSEVLSLPMHPYLDIKDQDYIINTLIDALKE
jgi:dTDP-4-amino-4,6-dideoxygalactose transaminase